MSPSVRSPYNYGVLKNVGCGHHTACSKRYDEVLYSNQRVIVSPLIDHIQAIKFVFRLNVSMLQVCAGYSYAA
jgi:hypothetical protein